MGVEAMEHMAHALGHTPLARYDAWRRARLRPFDIDGIDRPRADWRRGPHIRFAVRANPREAVALARLLASLEAQPYPNWSVAAILPLGEAPPRLWEPFFARGRLTLPPPGAATLDLAYGLDAVSLVGRCGPRDLIPESALAALAQHAATHTEEALIYADEDSVDPEGRFGDPRLKPDWCPAFQASCNYLGAAVFIRAATLAECAAPAALFADPGSNIEDCLALGALRIGHLRRVALSRAAPQAPFAAAPHRVEIRPASSTPLATIIIPTRDRVGLLRACVSSLVQKAGSTPFEVVIVDNASRKPATAAYLSNLARDGRFRVLCRPGPFNFSALNNEAATLARAPVLVFLNSDTQALVEGWLDPLVDLASRPGIGAVGAKLLFPSGRIQHAGVVLGLCGRADHIGAGLPGGDPGYLGWMACEREVSAVTGACMAILKATFDAAGGFNAADLPVDLNDIDLCLRLRGMGLRNIYTPRSVLLHHESASRGRMAQPSRVYAAERAYFLSRWGDAVRDDTCFHPALSLHSTAPALS